MKNLQSFLLFVLATVMMLSCGKEANLPVLEIESAMENARHYASNIGAEIHATNIENYLNDCNDAAFAEALQSTNTTMSFSGFDNMDDAVVYKSADDIMFYAVKRNSEANSGFLNVCIPFFEEYTSREPIILLEGPGVVGVDILTDILNEGEEEGGGRQPIVPIKTEIPGAGSFMQGYHTAFLTADARVEINYSVTDFWSSEGRLSVSYVADDGSKNINESYIIRF